MSEKTIEETMGEVYDRAQAAEAAPMETPVEAAPVETPEAPQEAEPAADGPARGPDGKFIAKTPAVETETAPATPNPAESASTPAAAETPSAPASWTAEAKAHWAAIPPAIQAEILKRETDVAKGFDERASKLKGYEPIEQVIGPRRQQLIAGYGSDAAALQELFQLSDYAARDPRGFIDMFAKSRGVDLGTVAAPQEPADPNDPIAALKQQVADITNQIQGQTKAQQDAQRAQLAQTVEQFRASGKAPHFEDVRADMIELTKAYPNDTIEQLYDRAAFANPTVRQRILEDQRAAEAAEQAKARRAEEDRRIAQTNVSTRNAVGGSPSAPRSMEETMREVYDRLNAA